MDVYRDDDTLKLPFLVSNLFLDSRHPMRSLCMTIYQCCDDSMKLEN